MLQNQLFNLNRTYFFKKNILLFLGLSLISLNAMAYLAPMSTLYRFANWRAVKAEENQQNSWASGTCSVGTNRLADSCCSGFLVADDIVMTNFHCLACAHKKGYDVMRTFSPKNISGDNWQAFLFFANKGYGLGIEMPRFAKESEPDPEAEAEQEILDNKSLALLNKKKGFGRVNFANLYRQKQDEEEIFEISEVIMGSRKLDFLLLRLKKKANEKHHVFQLSREPSYLGQQLVNVSHPGYGPVPDKKTIDESEECQISQKPKYDSFRYYSLGHQCDTTGGSSGSPLIDQKTGEVVALHWGGGAEMVPKIRISKLEKGSLFDMDQRFKKYRDDILKQLITPKKMKRIEESANRAIEMQAIVKHLEEKKIDLYKEIGL